MENFTITLPEPLRRHVEERAAAGGFETPGDYVRRLIEHDLHWGERGRIETAALEGLASGNSVEMDDAWWTKKYAEFDRRFGTVE